MKWSDVDFERNTITVRDGKSKRTDELPLHPQLAQELLERRSRILAMPNAKVSLTAVTDTTRKKDFLRAGLAREIVIRNENGEPVMTGKGKRRRPKIKIVTTDEDGRVIDLHAPRTILGAKLAKVGMSPQVAQKIMQHSDYKTTLEHYTALGISDTNQAISKVLAIVQDEAQLVVGTTDSAPHLKPHQLVHEITQNNATPYDNPSVKRSHDNAAKSSVSSTICDEVRDIAKLRGTPASVAQLVERQLPKLNVEGSNPFTRFFISARVPTQRADGRPH